ncbi:hypothetical protein AB91_5160, partial [Escherichia coli 2-460-02_S3_C1]
MRFRFTSHLPVNRAAADAGGLHTAAQAVGLYGDFNFTGS